MKKFLKLTKALAQVSFYIIIEDRDIDFSDPERGEAAITVNNYSV